MRGTGRRFVNILRSDSNPSRHYVGIASDPDERLTTAHGPWSIVVSIEFPTEKDALRFEGYLKSGSGAGADRPGRRWRGGFSKGQSTPQAMQPQAWVMAARFIFTEEAEKQLLEILDYLANESEQPRFAFGTRFTRAASA